MTRILAIDPGNTESAYALIDAETRRPILFGKDDNHEIRGILMMGLPAADIGAIEMIRSYGMAVGAEVFETCVWIGRFIEASGCALAPIYRGDVKLHHCHSSRAKDTNIRQALVDRFAPGQPNHGKGTKADPGWFHGFRADVWAAYALAVLVADRLEDVTP
ncbi:MAG: hypothetical protein ACXVXW_04895 [Mycobacteriaceae bacterium]